MTNHDSVPGAEHPEQENAPDAPVSEPVDAETGEPGAATIMGEALSEAARRAGIDPESDATTGAMVWQVVGGWRGVLESVLPLLTFIVAFVASEQLLMSLGLSVGIAAVFTIIRLVMKSPPMAALSGLFAAVIAAVVPLMTGRAEDQFLIGFLTNVGYGTVLLVSAAVTWPIIGLLVGFLMGEGVTWRRDVRKRRIFTGLTVAWALLFYARLGVQLPFYFAGDVATLGTVKLVMGIPLFATLLAVTWIVVRRAYPRVSSTADDAKT